MDAAGAARGLHACSGADPAMRVGALAHALDAEVIPRLVLARRAAPACVPLDERESGQTVARGDVATFTALVLEQDVGAAAEHIAALRARGVPLESVFLDLLGPAARCLGDMWNEDLCDFTQVTVGLWRLQQLVRELSPAFCDAAEPQHQLRRALLVPAQGEQHTFGLYMVAEFLRRAGWDVQAGPIASGSEMLSLVRNQWLAVVGISVSCETRLEGLAATIHAIRRASRNRGVGVMVGGPVFLERPELAALVGADASAVDGRQAALQAESLLALAARRA
jgi:methanogenic corrinoid protein MtbC1